MEYLIGGLFTIFMGCAAILFIIGLIIMMKEKRQEQESEPERSR